VILKKVYLITAFFLFVAALFLGLDRLCHQRSNHFSLNKITTSNLFSSRWGTPHLTSTQKKELRQILHQKFVLYDQGPRSYTCVSEDGNYSLKFLKYQSLSPRSWLGYIPLSINPYYQEFSFRRAQYEGILHAWKTAFTQLKKETGLIYMHADNIQKLHYKVIILDRNVQPHLVDLDKTIFCVRRHADLTYLRIAQLMREGDLEGAKGVITSVFSLIDHLGAKGAIDEDLCSDFNFGLIDDIAIQTNIGKLQTDLKSTSAYKKKVPFMTTPLHNWLGQRYPELLPHFAACLANSVA
jgi:hypothetical protein